MAEYDPVADLPDEYLIEIGRVAVAFNLLESLIHLCLIKVLGKELTDGRAHAVFAHMAFPQRLDVLSAMIEELILPPESPLSRYKQDIQPLLKESAARRNAILHQKWGVEDDVVIRSGINARGALQFTHKAVLLRELMDTTLYIKNASLVLYDAVVSNLLEIKEPGTG